MAKNKPAYYTKLYGATATEKAARLASEYAKLVAYLRVSTISQGDKYGLPSQLAAITRWAETNAKEIGHIYTDKITGDSETRDGLDAMKAAIRGGEVSEVAVLDLGRLARSFRVGDALYDELSKDVTVTSVTEGTFSDDYQSTFIRRIFQSAHEMEKARLLEKMADGRLESVQEDGRWPGGWGVLGYRSIGDGRVALVDEEAGIVVAIFELRADGLTLSAIAVEMNKRGVLTMMGRKWNNHLVNNVLLKQSFYAGETTTWLHAPSKKVLHTPILSPELVERLNHVVERPVGLLTTVEAARAIGVTANTILLWRKKGLIEAKMVRAAITDADGKRIGPPHQYFYDPKQLEGLKPQRHVKIANRTKPTPSPKLAPPTDTTPVDGCVSVLQAAALLHCSTGTVRKLVEQGDLGDVPRVVQPNGSSAWMIKVEDVMRLPAYAPDHKPASGLADMMRGAAYIPKHCTPKGSRPIPSAPPP